MSRSIRHIERRVERALDGDTALPPRVLKLRDWRAIAVGDTAPLRNLTDEQLFNEWERALHNRVCEITDDELLATFGEGDRAFGT